MSAHRRETAAVIILTIVALALRAWGANDAPLHSDEIHYAFDFMDAAETSTLHAVRDVACRMLEERRTAHPMAGALLARWLWFLPLGPFFDWSPGFLRGFHVILGTLAVPLAWATFRAAGDGRRGLVAALLAAISPGMVHISRTLYLDPVLVAFMGAMLLCISRARCSTHLGLRIGAGACYGLMLATKISPPIFAPAVAVGLLFAPRGTALPRRLAGAACGTAAALAVFLLFCDPVQYADRILHPSDPRYAEYNERGDQLNLMFTEVASYAATAAVDGPATTILVLGAALAMVVRRRDPFDALLVLALACGAPLLWLHIPLLSGPHGYMPLHYLLALLCAGPLATMPRRAAMPALGLHAAACAAGIALHATNHPVSGRIVQEDQAWTMIGDAAVERRDPPSQILVVVDINSERAFERVVRNAQLAEGAAFLRAIPGIPVSAGTFATADIALVQVAADAPPIEQPGFERLGRARMGYSLHYDVLRRAEGSTRRTFAAVPVPDLPGKWMLEGGVYPIAGKLLHGGDPVAQDAVPDPGAPVLDGRQDFSHWGTGFMVLPEDFPADAQFNLGRPDRRDIFWDF